MLELQNGQKVKIKFDTSSLTDIEITCTIKWYETDRICLVFPEETKEHIKDLPEGKEIGVVVYTSSGIFVFDSIIINSPLENNFVIELPDEKKKIQRREYIRAPINLKLVLKKDDFRYETKTINVGGGGIRFVAQDKLNIGDLWKFFLFLPGEKKIKGLGKILYTVMKDNNMASVIAFTDITETERNKLIKFCFDEEIKNLKSKKQESASL